MDKNTNPLAAKTAPMYVFHLFVYLLAWSSALKRVMMICKVQSLVVFNHLLAIAGQAGAMGPSSTEGPGQSH